MPEYNAQIDYYEVLQVNQRATAAVIKAAYRVILRELRAHPDLGGREDFARALNEAYRVLTDPELRRAYDGERLLVTARQGGESQLEQVIRCPQCGKSNALPLGTDRRGTRCTSCNSLLRVPDRPSVRKRRENIFGLSARRYRILEQESQVEHRPEEVAAGEVLRCRFCGNEWEAAKSGRPVPACPSCLRRDWYACRFLKCRVCGHEWRSARLGRWAYRDHPRCPDCSNARWSNCCESHPLRWFWGLLSP